MENSEKTSKIVFKYYYSNLTDKQKSSIRKCFLAASDVSYATFYNKLRNNKFSKLEQSKLDEICELNFSWE